MAPGDAAALDRAATGIDRPAFLAAWCTDTADRRSFGLRRDGALVAFGTVRLCRAGVKVGPLTAGSAGDAHRLLRALAGLFPDQPLVLDVPAAHADAVTLAGSLGLRPDFETARMYRGPAPGGAAGRVWGVATLELG